MEQDKTHTDNTTHSSKRGTIVVDTSSLYTLMAPVKEKFRTGTKQASHHIETYLDILPILARHGYRIVIPALVAFEANGTLAGCQYNASDFFLNNDAEVTKQKRVCKRVIDRFLVEVENGNYPGIEIQHSEYTEKAKELCKLLQSINRSMSSSSRPFNRDKKRFLISSGNARMVRYMLIRFRDYIRGKDAADDEIIEIAKHGDNIFILSKDGRLQYGVTEYSKNVINMGGMLAGLEKNGILPYLGLREDMIVAMFMDAQVSPMNKEDGRSPTALLVDSNSGAGKNNYPFLRFLKGLKQQLEEEIKQQSGDVGNQDNLDAVSPASTESRAAKFAAKFGKSTEQIIAEQQARQKKKNNGRGA